MMSNGNKFFKDKKQKTKQSTTIKNRNKTNQNEQKKVQ